MMHPTTPDDLNDALGDVSAPQDTLEGRVARLELAMSALMQGHGTAADPDAVPGEVVVSEREVRKAGGDGGTVAAYAYPLPKPLGHLRVRVTGEAMVILWRSPDGQRHEARFPL